jgi:transcriptional regulator GlxA family with amidase domain
MPTPASRPVRVAILAFDGCMTSAVTGLLDTLQIANRWIASGTQGPREAFLACVLGATATVTGSAGFLVPCEPLAAMRPIDVAIVPPIFGDIAETLRENRAMVSWLARRAGEGSTVASVCTGAFFLAEAGLLAGRRATTNPMFADAFRRAHPSTALLLDRRLVDDGRVLSAGSTTAFLDLAVYLVDRFAGHEVAVATAKALAIDKNHRSQLPYFLHFAEKGHGDAAVLALQTWLEEDFARPIGARQMARRVAVSQRSLNRRFLTATGLTPIDYLHGVRIEAAKRLLETSDLTVAEITSRVGYQDPRSFSRLFRTSVGLSPAGYRERFGAASA